MSDRNNTLKNNKGSDQGPSYNPPPKEDGSSGAILPNAVVIINTDDNKQVAIVEQKMTGHTPVDRIVSRREGLDSY